MLSCCFNTDLHRNMLLLGKLWWAVSIRGSRVYTFLKFVSKLTDQPTNRPTYLSLNALLPKHKNSCQISVLCWRVKSAMYIWLIVICYIDHILSSECLAFEGTALNHPKLKRSCLLNLINFF